MKMIHVAVAATLAFGSASSFAISLGNINLSSGSAGFSNTPAIGSFVDTLTFTVTSASFFNGSVTSAVNGNQDVDFTTIALTGPSGPFNFTQVLSDPVELFATPAAGFTISAGTYTLTLSGSNSLGGGSYAGNLAVTPVPEPETLALMLAGMGVVGFLARRRRN